MISGTARPGFLSGVLIGGCCVLSLILIRKFVFVPVGLHGKASIHDAVDGARNDRRLEDMGRAVSGVVHEIRNPLFGITSIAQILEQELTRPEHRELTGALLSETRRLNELVEDLLLLTRPVKLAVQPCDLALLWREAVDTSREELSNKAIPAEIDCEESCTLPVDGKLMKRVFRSVLSNAIDATPQGGKIRIALATAGDAVICTVSDTGAGIPEDKQEHVFDLFYSTKPKRSGLGLPICRKIVEDHGGNISVRSGTKMAGTPGATITIRLPNRTTSPSST